MSKKDSDLRVHRNGGAKYSRPARPVVHSPVQIIRAAKETMDYARQEAAGRDVHIEVQPDGSVLIVNGAR